MISKTMTELAGKNSAIRAMFEEGGRLAAIYGRENVYDFSIGNPNIPAPAAVNEAIIDIVKNEESTFIHGYMPNPGFQDVRETVAKSLNRRFETDYSADNIIMTVGAAGGLNAMFKTLLNPGDEVIAFAPFFLEYGNYVRNFGGNLVAVPPNLEDFSPNPMALAERVTKNTKAVIINSPNNPTGIVYTEKMIRDIAAVLEEKQREFGTSIYIISDEPYRELVYDGVTVPWLAKFYRNTIVGYSWSKSLSLPGERIGYLVVPSDIDEYSLIFSAACIANRILGYVNAPSLLQRVVMRCIDQTTDITPYDENRKLLYSGLREYGFECAVPQGAFYMWVKAPCEDVQFVEAAKKYRILIVPGSSFACPGYVRIAYCVAYNTIKNSLPAFRKLAEEFGLCK